MRAFELYEEDTPAQNPETPGEAPEVPAEKPELVELREQVGKLMEFIQHHCQPWIDETMGGSLVVWRGMRGRPTTKFVDKYYNHDHLLAGTRTVVKDRRPKDTPGHIHDLFNKILGEMNIAANRSNSLFVSGSRDQASSYGDRQFVIIPVGQFTFAWNTKYSDVYSGWRDIRAEMYPDNPPPEAYEEYIPEALKKILAEPYKDQIKEHLIKQKVLEAKIKYHKMDIKTLQTEYKYRVDWHADTSTWSKSKLATQLAKSDGRSYRHSYYFDEHLSAAMQKFAMKLKATPEQKEQAKAMAIKSAKRNDYNGNYTDPQKMYDLLMKYYKDTDLEEAIKSNHEIIINCDEYLMISAELWNLYVEPILTQGKSVSDIK